MKVLVVSGSEVLRGGLSLLLDSIPCVSEHVEVDTPHLPVPWQSEPDVNVVLVDQASWTDVIERDRSSAEAPPPLVILLVTDLTPVGLNSALHMKVDGYLMLSEVTTEALRDTLRCVQQGTMPLPSQLAARILEQLRQPSHVPSIPNLTPRETEVLDLLVEGLSNQEIARTLGISLHGAKRHVSSILSKFGCPNRAHVVSTALRAGLRPTTAPEGKPGKAHVGRVPSQRPTRQLESSFASVDQPKVSGTSVAS